MMHRAGSLPPVPKVIGHRGAARHAPENTLASARRAFELGASWIEVDVKLSADGVPFLMHDDTLDRTTSGTGPAAALAMSELARLDAGAWFGATFSGEPVPSLAMLIDLADELQLGCNIEIKPCPGRVGETGQVVMDRLLAGWPADLPLLVSSFSRAALRAARAVAPGVPFGLLAGPLPSDAMAALDELGCVSLHLDHRLIDQAVIDRLRVAGTPLLAYTVNDADRAARLLESGVVSVITDAPDLILPRVPQ